MGNEYRAAGSIDKLLRRLMPTTSGTLSYAAVARHCGCSSATPRAWLLQGDEISVPDQPARGRLAALVKSELGRDAADALVAAWAALDDATSDSASTDLAAGDGGTTAPRPASSNASGETDLSLDDRRLVVEQASLVLDEAYAHLPFKRALHAVDPVQRLKLLNYRLSQQRPGDQPEAAFHREMIDIFTSLRDLHTSYVVPSALREAVVLLPFRVEEYFEQTADGNFAPVYVSSKVDTKNAQVVATSFADGVQITHWNGVRIHRAIELLAERQAAGNAPAAFARALDELTLRPLLSSMEPDEDWVDVTYLDADGGSHEARFRWIPRKAPLEILPDHLRTPLGIDAQTHAVGAVRKELYGHVNQGWDAAQEQNGELAAPVALRDFHLKTTIPWRFRAHETRDGRFGYIRIFSFAFPRPQQFIAEFARLAAELPPTGLIIDVRGNAGGSIVAAEGTLQVLSPHARIRPTRAQFTTSPLLLNICENHREASRHGPALGPWVDSLRQAVITGSAYSRGFPITPDSVLDAIDVHYQGPVVLIVDALCYSATDMFAAGFIDHDLGTVIGTADNTGAGGANVWRHRDLVKLAGEDSDLERLPGGIDFTVAVRRTTRVHEHEGEILEDLGIQVTNRHYMTKRDVFEGNVDLIAAAGVALANRGGRSAHR